MRLLIDAGNTRLKWRVDRQGVFIASGISSLDSQGWLDDLIPYAPSIDHIAVSTVVSEVRRSFLESQLARITEPAVRFFWSEASRGGLENSYADVSRMGADRWHAMYAAWQEQRDGFAVIDAGSAITIDYVSADGAHLGGYILPGKQMMLRSLRQDAARIDFELLDARASAPGVSTAECVQHGVAWLWEGLVQHVVDDCRRYKLNRVLCTGGDAPALLSCGLPGRYDPDLVLSGLAAIDSESAPP